MRHFPIIVLVGNQQSGKSTLIKEMLARVPELRVLRSITTRAPREPDDAIFYRFTSRFIFRLLRFFGLIIQAVKYGENFYGNTWWDFKGVLLFHTGIAAVTQEGVLTLRAQGHRVIAINVVRPPGEFTLENTPRGHDDARRREIPIAYNATIVNSFEPGGLTKATNELETFIRSTLAALR